MHLSRTFQNCVDFFKFCLAFYFCFRYLFLRGCSAQLFMKDRTLQSFPSLKNHPATGRLQKRTVSMSSTVSNRSAFLSSDFFYDSSKYMNNTFSFDNYHLKYLDVYDNIHKLKRTVRSKGKLRKAKSSKNSKNGTSTYHSRKGFSNLDNFQRKIHASNEKSKKQKPFHLNNRLNRKSKGRKKNLEDNHEGFIVGMKDYEVKAINTNSYPTNQLCPEWPRDPNREVNCSKGRKIRSVCSVSCAPGFRLPKGSPGKRRCQKNSRKRGRHKANGSTPAWSGKNNQFVCVPICVDLEKPNNGKVICDGRKVHNSVRSFFIRSCIVTCDPGYSPSHSPTRFCLRNGTWTGQSVTCRAISHNQKRSLFVPHQRLECGNVNSLTTFKFKQTTYLAVGDMTEMKTRIYKWCGQEFLLWQILETKRPQVVEVVPRKRKRLCLLVGNEDFTSVYQMNDDNNFVFLKKRKDFLITSSPSVGNLQNGTKGMSYLRVNSDIYRCKGNYSKRGRSIIFVQKLIIKKNKRPTFKRIMRKKMRNGESIVQCSMFFVSNRLYTAVSIVKRNGEGKVLFGTAQKKRMRITHSLTQRQLRNVSDIEVFKTSNNDNMLVISQSASEGQCFVFKKNAEIDDG